MKILIALILLVGLVGCSKNDDNCCCKPTTTVEKSKDPVCGMWVEKKKDLYPLLFDGVMYYFCCNDCALTFANNTAKYASTCDCKKYKRDCKCDHCAGKQVPCDCR